MSAPGRIRACDTRFRKAHRTSGLPYPATCGRAVLRPSRPQCQSVRSPQSAHPRSWPDPDPKPLAWPVLLGQGKPYSLDAAPLPVVMLTSRADAGPSSRCPGPRCRPPNSSGKAAQPSRQPSALPPFRGDPSALVGTLDERPHGVTSSSAGTRSLSTALRAARSPGAAKRRPGVPGWMCPSCQRKDSHAPPEAALLIL